MVKIITIIRNGKRFDFPKDKLVTDLNKLKKYGIPDTGGVSMALPFSKGGPGSGRYPKGSGEEGEDGGEGFGGREEGGGDKSGIIGAKPGSQVVYQGTGRHREKLGTVESNEGDSITVRFNDDSLVTVVPHTDYRMVGPSTSTPGDKAAEYKKIGQSIASEYMEESKKYDLDASDRQNFHEWVGEKYPEHQDKVGVESAVMDVVNNKGDGPSDEEIYRDESKRPDTRRKMIKSIFQHQRDMLKRRG